MASLHLVFTAPTAGSALADCLRACSDGDRVLLLQDGVHAAVARARAPSQLLREAAAGGIVLHALAADIQARGLTALLHPGVTVVDDTGFVALTETCPRIISWY